LAPKTLGLGFGAVNAMLIKFINKYDFAFCNGVKMFGERQCDSVTFLSLIFHFQMDVDVFSKHLLDSLITDVLKRMKKYNKDNIVCDNV
jgi:hypothetical protein